MSVIHPDSHDPHQLALLRRFLVGLAAVVGGVAALWGYFVYTPAQQIPSLAGAFTRDSIQVNGHTRTYGTYLPRDLPRAAPLVLVLHGAGESGARIRVETGYAFDRLADSHHFAVVYPNALAHGGDWNACGSVGDDSREGTGIDDVRFATELIDKLITTSGVDPARIFVVGSSRGGFMALRLALEAPSRFRAAAAVSASVHTPDNFKCRPPRNGTPSVLIMNGTKDPLVPFDGGNISLLGFSYKYGRVMSSRESAKYFADLNHLSGAPASAENLVADGVRVERVLWHDDATVEVELVAIHGGGHGIPQPYQRHPRLLGPSPREPNGPELIWAFFERQPTAAAQAPALAGRWQYLQPPDEEGEVLDLSIADGQWHGVMNGLLRAGEHGVLYYVAAVESLSVDPAGAIRFEVGERLLSRVRPALSVLGGKADDGVDRYRMHFTGRLDGGDLVLHCADSEGGSCPDATLRFKRR